MLQAIGYKYKKDLKAAIGQRLNYLETSFFGAEYKETGSFCICNKKRSWFATVTMKDNVIIKVE